MKPLPNVIVPGPAPFASFREFFKLEAAGGVVLFGAAVLAMLLKNSPASAFYADLLTMPVQIRVGSLDLDKPLFLWVNDGLMAVFFFMVALEIKQEMLVGHLADKSSLELPLAAAAGGMFVPAALFTLFNLGDTDALHGWAIPAATDIAFALGVLALVGPRVPVTLKVFLLTLAVLDDLGAIVAIAVFYSSKLSLTSIVAGLIVVAALITLNRTGVRRLAPYILLGIVLWIAVLKSGVHATLAGVILGFAIPLGDREDETQSPLRHLVHELHPWVAFGILPMFAFFNAGIVVADINPANLISGVPLGIAVGLFVGKPVGVLTFSWIAIKTKIATLPEQVNWRLLIGVSFLCGIGFTMSMFLGGLAFQEGGSGYAKADRIGIIVGSLLSGIVGYLLLRSALRSEAKSSDSIACDLEPATPTHEANESRGDDAHADRQQ